MQLNQNTKLKRVACGVLAAVILLVYFLLLNQKPWKELSIRNTTGTVGYREEHWQFGREDSGEMTDLRLPAFRKMETGSRYILSTVLTYDGSRDDSPYGFLHLDHVFCRILLDGEELFSYMPEDAVKFDGSKSPGFIYKDFALPHDCLGRELRIELLPMLTIPVEYGLPDIQFGDYTAVVHSSVLRDVPQNIVVILSMVMGISAILFSAVVLEGNGFREGISIGIFSLLFSIYLITETRINLYFIGNPYYTYLANYLSFAILPISLMGFMRERLMEKQRKLCSTIIFVELILFLLEMFLHFHGFLDWREAVSAIHLVYFVEAAVIVVLIQFIDNKKKKYSLIVQMMPVAVGMLFDVTIYWQHWDIGGNDATFTILGVNIFLIVEMIHVWKSSVSIYTESVRSNLYRQLAYVDELTGAGNRRAYDSEISDIISGAKTYASMIVVSADVNKLKYVNDNFGHAAGDELIRSAAHIIMEAVQDSGRVFRTGGDEFSLFLYDINMEQYEKIMSAADEKVDAFNRESQFAMSLAVGYVQIYDDQILDAVQEADRKMYEDKVLQKAVREQ